MGEINIYMDLIPFIPKTANYQIWYPEDFIVDEDEKGDDIYAQ